MSVSEHMPSFLVGALSLAIIVSGYSFVNYSDSISEKNTEFTAKEIENNIGSVSRFPEGYIQMSLESPFKFEFEESGLLLVKDSKKYRINTDASIKQNQDFKASTICIKKNSNVEVSKGEC